MSERKVYTAEFKREAVRLAQERGNIRATARDLGVSDTSLENWTKQLRQSPQTAFAYCVDTTCLSWLEVGTSA